MKQQEKILKSSWELFLISIFSHQISVSLIITVRRFSSIRPIRVREFFPLFHYRSPILYNIAHALNSILHGWFVCSTSPNCRRPASTTTKLSSTETWNWDINSSQSVTQRINNKMSTKLERRFLFSIEFAELILWRGVPTFPFLSTLFVGLYFSLVWPSIFPSTSTRSLIYHNIIL